MLTEDDAFVRAGRARCVGWNIQTCARVSILARRLEDPARTVRLKAAPPAYRLHGSVFLAMMVARVVDGYFTFHGESGVTEAERDAAMIELEDWAARLTDDYWKAFLDRLPYATGNAY